jgi:hypothetical protein
MHNFDASLLCRLATISKQWLMPAITVKAVLPATPPAC